MTQEKDNIIGNTTSIFKTIGLITAGYIIPLLASKGLSFNGQETQITQLLGAIIGLTLSYIDMKYTNSFFKKNITIDDYINYGIKNFDMTIVEDKKTPETTDLLLNHEYTTKQEDNMEEGA